MAYSQWDVNYQIPNFNLDAQKADTSALLGRYSNAISGMESIPALASRYEGQLGIPNLREAYSGLGEVGEGLRSSYLGMPEQVAGTSRESLMTEGQRQGLVQSKQAPIVENMTEVGRQQGLVGQRLTGAEGQLSNLMGYEMAQQERSLLPFEKEFSTLEQFQAREFSGYTFREQNELDKLIGNAQRGYQWTTDEANRANALALKEQEYKNALGLMREEYGYKKSMQSPISTNSGDWFYDASSGWVPVID